MATRGLVLLAKDTFSGVSTVSFDNVFSSTYKQYKIILQATGSTNSQFQARLRASGSDNASAVYTRQSINASSSSVTAGRSTGLNQWGAMNWFQNTPAISIVEILNPFQSTYTSAVTVASFDPEGTPQIDAYAFGITVTTSYDGITFLVASGTATGTITVYGLAQ